MTLGYINPEKIAEKLNGFNGVKITGFENSVIMRGTKESLLEIGKIIQILDKPKKQVIIKAIIENRLSAFAASSSFLYS